MYLYCNQRKNIRLKNFNYSSNGYYFVTFCTESRLCLFGDIKDGKLLLNQTGLMVHNEIATIDTRYIGIHVDKFIVMPNHVHAIILINNDIGPVKSLSSIIRNIKTYTTKIYGVAAHSNNWPAYNKRLWQRGYYESIIRDKNSLRKIREYIILNPSKWEYDPNDRDLQYL